MPSRPNQHQIEDISRAKFQLKLPRQWVYRNKENDYGIDSEVEIFDEKGKSEGLVFWVQLKATESTEKSSILSVDFKIDTLLYYKSLDVPVLLARYSDAEDSIYIKWINNVDLYGAKQAAKTFRVKLSKDDEWNDCTSEKIKTHLTKLRQIKLGRFNLPVPVYLSIVDSKIHDISKGILTSQVKTELTRYSDYLSLTTPEEALINIVLKSDILEINLTGFTGCYFHNISLREKDKFTIHLSQDIVLGVALTLIHASQVDYAARIIFEGELDSRLLNKQELLGYSLPALFQSSYFVEVLNIVHKIPDDYQDLGLEIITQLNILFASKTSSDKRVKAIGNFFKEKLEKTKDAGEDEQIGIAHYNLGNHFKGRKLFGEAIHHYNLARKFAPIYLKQAYFFSEIGGMLFDLDKYKSAVSSYGESLRLQDDIHVKALYADSLMFNGEYKESLKYFSEYLDNSENPLDQFILKCICLESLIRDYKIESQIRNRSEANKLADIKRVEDFSDPIAETEKAFEFDLLCEIAWFNLGVSHTANSENDNAGFCFVMAGLLSYYDIEAWRNSTLCSFNSDQLRQFLPLIVRTAYRFNGEKYLEDLYAHIENQTSKSIDPFIEMIQSLLPKPEINKTLPTIRIPNENGDFENLFDFIERQSDDSDEDDV